jgi:hypothetical protein
LKLTLRQAGRALDLLWAQKAGPFLVRVSAVIPLAGRSGDDEGLEVFGRAEGVILKQGADGMPVADICRKAGISQATYFNWKKRYDGLLPTESATA